MSRPVSHLAAAVAVAAAVAAAAGPTAAGAATSTSGRVAFTATYVSTTLGGGEPFVIYSHSGKDLVFSSHESTTLTKANPPNLLLSPGSSCDLSDPTAPSGFVCSYHNQVNIWHSTDSGTTWALSTANPLYTGFSDPSLTEDAGGRIYDTGIDLANEALFSSTDGGRTFPTGTPQCHDGDRPWLAGGKAGEVFLSTDTVEAGHEVYHSTDGGATCSSAGIEDDGSYRAGTYSGFGQLLYDHHDGSLVEPADFMDPNGNVVGVGISTLPHASTATFGTTNPTRFTPSAATLSTSEIDHWPAIALDAADTIYVVWSTNPRTASSTSGCSVAIPNQTGGPALRPNEVMLSYTRNHGRTWSRPQTVAHPGTTVIWPWVVAGAAGHVAVTWYQSSQLTDPDCDSASLLTGGHPTAWTVRSAVLTAATSASSYPASSVNAVPSSSTHPGGVFHVGGICQGGTTCLATGQDRRIGDYFTNALDGNGCLMIATGDTSIVDSITGAQFAQSRPLFLHQTSGASLTTGRSCAVASPVSRSAAGERGASSGSGSGTGSRPSSTTSAVLARTGLDAALPLAGLALMGTALAVVVVRRWRRPDGT